MWCLFNVKTHETFARHVQRWTTTRTENDDGVRPFFSKMEGTERVEFQSLDEASRYAARFDLVATGWSPQPILENNVATWDYEPIECNVCKRSYWTARDANRCVCKSFAKEKSIDNRMQRRIVNQ